MRGVAGPGAETEKHVTADLDVTLVTSIDASKRIFLDSATRCQDTRHH